MSDRKCFSCNATMIVTSTDPFPIQCQNCRESVLDYVCGLLIHSYDSSGLYPFEDVYASLRRFYGVEECKYCGEDLRAKFTGTGKFVTGRENGRKVTAPEYRVIEPVVVRDGGQTFHPACHARWVEVEIAYRNRKL